MSFVNGNRKRRFHLHRTLLGLSHLRYHHYMELSIKVDTLAGQNGFNHALCKLVGIRIRLFCIRNLFSICLHTVRQFLIRCVICIFHGSIYSNRFYYNKLLVVLFICPSYLRWHKIRTELRCRQDHTQTLLLVLFNSISRL